MSENAQETSQKEPEKKNNRLSKKQQNYLNVLRVKKTVTDACKGAQISRAIYYKWYKDSEKFRHAVADVEDEKLDFAESKLFEAIEAGKEKSIHYFLDSKGKSRGYGAPKALEIGGPGGNKIDDEIRITLVKAESANKPGSSADNGA